MSEDVNKTARPSTVAHKELPDLTEHIVTSDERDQNSSSQYVEIRRSLIVEDIRKFPLAISRVIRFLDSLRHINIPETLIIRAKKSLTTFYYDGSYWTTVNEEPTVNRESPASENVDDSILFIPQEFHGHPHLSSFSKLDTLQFLRTTLENLDFYRSHATFIREIQIKGLPDGADDEAPPTFPGFSVEAPVSREGWVDIIEQATEIGDDMKAYIGRFNTAIPERVARPALKKLITLANTLKEIGIAMDSWRYVMVNMITGDISLGEGDYPRLIDARRLNELTNKLAQIEEEQTSSNDLFYIPNLSALATQDNTFFKSEKQLLTVVRFLRIVGGFNTQSPTQRKLVKRFFNDFGLYIDHTNDNFLHEAFLKSKETIKGIIEEYLETFPIDIDHAEISFKGILNFLIYAMPGIMKTALPENWFGNAYELINDAKEKYEASKEDYSLNKFNLDVYWAEVAESLVQKIMNGETPYDKGGNNSGTPSSGNPAGGGGILGNDSGPTIAKAQGNEFITEISFAAPTYLYAGRQIPHVAIPNTQVFIPRAPIVNIRGALTTFNLKPLNVRPLPILH